MLVFLGVPLAIYLIFVVSPFIQACYYALTDWSGFTSTQNFVGVWPTSPRCFTDDIFMKALRNNIMLALVLPVVTLTLSFALACLVTVSGTSRGQTRGLQRLRVLPDRLVLPLRDPGHRDRHHVGPDLRPEQRSGERRS